MSDTAVIWLVGLGLVLVVGLPFVLMQRKRALTTDAWVERAERHGLREPISLHPVIDPFRCIGTGSCISVCPEIDVIGFRDGRAMAVAPARCIGHGLCERACPMDAIQLVFGTSRRGVELPRVQEDFQTNVPGLYIVGELGGMGLIRNAFEQGRQCIETIAGLGGRDHDLEHDVIIVGCGPAGLSASLTCAHHGLRYLTLEREEIGGTVRHYPRKKLVMTEPVQVPGFGRIGAREIAKEELVDLWEKIVANAGLEVRTRETVARIGRLEGGTGFEVETDRGVWRGRRVVLAIGRRGVPRKLGVPGEDLPNVLYSLREPEVFRENRITVVGGGDSAVEAALSLAEQAGNGVRLSYRKDRLSRIKQTNRERIGEAIDAGRVQPLWSTQVRENRSDRAAIVDRSGETSWIPNDYLFVMIGGELPTPFLRACGVEIEKKFGQP